MKLIILICTIVSQPFSWTILSGDDLVSRKYIIYLKEKRFYWKFAQKFMSEYSSYVAMIFVCPIPQNEVILPQWKNKSKHLCLGIARKIFFCQMWLHGTSGIYGFCLTKWSMTSQRLENLQLWADSDDRRARHTLFPSQISYKACAYYLVLF